MAINLRPLSEQVMVITGASSGIGLATAQAAAAAGAKLVLAARSVDALNEIVEDIQRAGGDAISVECDVAVEEDVADLADAAIRTYGRIDTWVNNAGIGMYGRLEETDAKDAKRMFDINFWGVVYGSQAALSHLSKTGGALINIGSEASDAYPPLLGMYSASKHAVKGYTDALRVEIEEVDNAPVSITLIQPTAVNTPFPQHARNFMEKEPKLPEPMIDPQKVAEAILDAAVSPTRDKSVGGMSLVNTVVSKVLPNAADKMAKSYVKKLQYDEAPRDPMGALYKSSAETEVVGVTHGIGGRTS